MARRSICVVTGTRAEYGLLCDVMSEVQEDPDMDLQTLVTGMHLSPEFGLTYQEVEADGFEITDRVEMLVSSDTPVGTAKSMGLGTIGFADAFDRLDPDVVVVLGDRFEILAAAQAALVARIPVAHIQGGEKTEGAVDESIRHAVTKMAYIHFVAAESFRRRVIQLGEHPSRVFKVGAPGLDVLRRVPVLDRGELEASLNFQFGDPTFLITYHPATLEESPPERSIEELLRALDRFPNARLLFTKSNADAGGRLINQKIETYAEKEGARARAYSSLGQRRYVSALHNVDVVVGNSSSGIIEAPAIPVPTVNIGDRQSGRPRAESVIDCEGRAMAIEAAIRKAMSEPFRKRIEGQKHPYGAGNTSEQICHHLKQVCLDHPIKQFYDLENGKFSAHDEEK